jgi:hypothetical protein
VRAPLGRGLAVENVLLVLQLMGTMLEMMVRTPLNTWASWIATEIQAQRS